MNLIFDLDGTLLDSEPWHRRSEIEVFRDHFGIEITDADLAPFMGRKLEHVVAALAPGVDLDEFKAVHTPVLRRFLREEVRLFEDARRCLAALDVPLALATSSPRWYVDEAQAAFSELTVFDAVAAGDEVARSKPEPDIFLLAARRLGVDPADCTVIEDAPSGVEAARRAGCRVIHLARETAVDNAHASIATLDALHALL